ncbi:hypothetical protein [Streptomyces vinaceus]|uniref:hypothetical protein n=1 Tax=Streptomyces vinaceus TaxID=1960 RepID=UPI0019CEF65C|nr:hypothetical protein [Streptomyces vinaceus]GHE58668.1 hypothetical protein GCM10017778_48810 [Streptomyces vinaceus]
MTESGQGGSPQAGTPWGPDPAYPQPGYGYPPPAQPEPGRPAYGYPPAAGQAPAGPPQPEGQPQPGPPAHAQPPAPGQAPPGHVVGPGYEGPGAPHGYGYPPLPEAVTQYIPPVPAGDEGAAPYPPVPGAPAHDEGATQYIPPVPAGDEGATQYIPPVPPGAAHEEAATQYIPPVPGGAGPGEAATQYIPPVTDGFDALFREEGQGAGHTRQLPPVQEPVLRQPPPRGYPPRGQRPGPAQPQPFPQPPQAQQPQPFQQHPQAQQHPQQQPQYAPPPPPPEAGRRVPAWVIAAVVIGLAVVGLGVGALLSDGKKQNNDPAAADATPSAGSSAAAGAEAPVDPARSQAVQLDKLLADSNDSRAAVIRSVDDIKGCRNLGQAATDLRDAARQREELVTRLQDLKMDQLPDNAKLAAALTKAWQSSAAADNSYAAWADDTAADKKGCKDGQAKGTGNANEGNKASGEATKAKESAATMWNAIAAKYALTKRDKSQL